MNLRIILAALFASMAQNEAQVESAARATVPVEPAPLLLEDEPLPEVA